MIISVHTDGGSRGNPGPSGFGVSINDETQKILYQKGVFLGIMTNNEAEYAGLTHALEWLATNQDIYPIERINLFMDSELIVNQLNGKYKVKAEHLKPLYLNCLKLIASIKAPLEIRHVMREKNSLADELANQAMDHET